MIFFSRKIVKKMMRYRLSLTNPRGGSKPFVDEITDNI